MVSSPLNLHSYSDKVPFVGLLSPPKILEQKATTKVTLTSQQNSVKISVLEHQSTPIRLTQSPQSSVQLIYLNLPFWISSFKFNILIFHMHYHSF